MSAALALPLPLARMLLPHGPCFFPCVHCALVCLVRGAGPGGEKGDPDTRSFTVKLSLPLQFPLPRKGKKEKN